MDETKINDKIKMQEIINEITNLKIYCGELANNTRGEALDNYINNLEKNINLFGDEAEKIYTDLFKTID